MTKISACLVVKNEEKLIGRCLESLVGAVDEIIIVHDGLCVDKTVEIGKQYKARIFVQEDFINCNPHRPFSFEQASHEWILQIDADEYLSADLAKNMRSLVQNSEIDAYEFLWPIWSGEKYLTKKWPHKRCLLKKSKASFLGIPNYVPDIEGNIRKSDLILEHRPLYDNFSFVIFKKKLLPKSRMQAGIYLKEFREIRKFNCAQFDWPKKIKLRRRFPLLLAPLEFIITVYKNLSSGAWREGVTGWKIAFMFGVYRLAMNYYIFIEKVKSKKS
jgi:glycosyltransferase involved in cell wall biosynthesis